MIAEKRMKGCVYWPVKTLERWKR